MTFSEGAAKAGGKPRKAWRCAFSRSLQSTVYSLQSTVVVVIISIIIVVVIVVVIIAVSGVNFASVVRVV